MSNFLNKENNMYIRRKVFSQAMDWDNDYDYEMEERLYSTGDYELDEILERAFCEGYEAAQREFGDDESYDELIGAGIGAGAVGLGAAGAYGYHKGVNKLKERAIEKIKNDKSLNKAAKAEKIAKWKDGKLAKSDAMLAKYLGKEGTVAKKVQGWADSAQGKLIDQLSKKRSTLIERYNKGEMSKKAYDKAIAKLEKGGNVLQRSGKWIAEKVKNNPRAAAAAAAGIAAAGIGAGAGYAHRKMNED